MIKIVQFDFCILQSRQKVYIYIIKHKLIKKQFLQFLKFYFYGKKIATYKIK